VVRFSAEQALNHPWIKENRRPPLKVAVQGRLNNLRNYRSDPITHTVMTLIAHQSLADSNEQKMVFMELSSNHDGCLTRDDLIVNGCSEYEAEAIILRANSSQTGSLSYAEWLVASSEKKELMSLDNLKNVFDSMDVKKSGFIDTEQLAKFVDGSGPVGENLSFEQFVGSLHS